MNMVPRLSSRVSWLCVLFGFAACLPYNPKIDSSNLEYDPSRETQLAPLMGSQEFDVTYDSGPSAAEEDFPWTWSYSTFVKAEDETPDEPAQPQPDFSASVESSSYRNQPPYSGPAAAPVGYAGDAVVGPVDYAGGPVVGPVAPVGYAGGPVVGPVGYAGDAVVGPLAPVGYAGGPVVGLVGYAGGIGTSYTNPFETARVGEELPLLVGNLMAVRPFVPAWNSGEVPQGLIAKPPSYPSSLIVKTHSTYQRARNSHSDIKYSQDTFDHIPVPHQESQNAGFKGQTI